MHYVSKTYRNVYTSLNTDRMRPVIAYIASETSNVQEISTIDTQVRLTCSLILVYFVSGECKNLQELNLSECGNVTVRKISKLSYYPCFTHAQEVNVSTNANSLYVFILVITMSQIFLFLYFIELFCFKKKIV